MKRTGLMALLVIALIATLLTVGAPSQTASAQDPPDELVLAIAKSGDDVEQLDGVILFGSGDLDVADGYIVGLRYSNVCVDGPDDIASATLRLTGDEDDTAPTSATITGYAIADAPGFTSGVLLEGLPRTGTSESWDIPPWAPGDQVTSPDLGAVVREIVGQPGWVSCNDIVLFIDGTGDREAKSYNASPAEAPQLTIVLNDAEPPPPADDLVFAIGRGSDDVEQLDGAVLFGSGDLDVADGYIVGLRYTEVCIDDAASISSATLTLTGDEEDTAATSATITGYAIADAPAFDTAILLDGLPRTSASESWSIPAWSPGDQVTSPDLGAVVREIVGQAGWVSCNDIVLFIDGTGDREAKSYNASPAEAPTLTITIDDAPPPAGTDDELRVAAVTQVIGGLESLGAATGSNVVFGGGWKGLGTGWYQLDNGGSYPGAILDVLVDGGHLDADGLLFDPNDTVLGAHSTNDFLIYRCANRVAVFSKSDGSIDPSAEDAAWWADNNCTNAAFNKAHPYFQIATPLDYDSTRVAAVAQAVTALESYGAANNTFKVTGGGSGGNGQGFYQRDNDGSYPDAISAVLAAEGHLDLAGLIVDPVDIELDKHTAWDLKVHRCKDRVGVFARNDATITPSAADATWWTDNGCINGPFNSRHTYFALSRPIDELGGAADDDIRVSAVAQAVGALERYAAANGAYKVAGGGWGGNGNGWYQLDNDGTYPDAIMNLLIDGGYLDADGLILDPNDTILGQHSSNDLRVHRCQDRVAVFSRTDALVPSAADQDWWSVNGCTTAPFNSNHTYYQVARPLDEVYDVDAPMVRVEVTANGDGTRTAEVLVDPQTGRLGAVELVVSLDNDDDTADCEVIADGTTACGVGDDGTGRFAVGRDAGWSSEFSVGRIQLPAEGEVEVDVIVRYDIVDGDFVERPTGDGPAQDLLLAPLAEPDPFAIQPTSPSIPNGSRFVWTWSAAAAETAWNVTAWDENDAGTRLRTHPGPSYITGEPIRFVDEVLPGRDATQTCIEVTAGATTGQACVPIAGTGDINCDGVLNVLDAFMIAQATVGLPPPSGIACYEIDQADISGDGRINILDALIVAQCSVGLINRGCPSQPLASPRVDLTLIVTALTRNGYRPHQYFETLFNYEFTEVDGATSYDVTISQDGEAISEFSRDTARPDDGDYVYPLGGLRRGEVGLICVDVVARAPLENSAPGRSCESGPEGTPATNRMETPEIVLELDVANDDLNFTVDGVNRNTFGADLMLVYSKGSGNPRSEARWLRRYDFHELHDWNPIARGWTGVVCVLYSPVDRSDDAMWPAIPGRGCIDMSDYNPPTNPFQPPKPEVTVDKTTIAVGESVAFDWDEPNGNYQYNIIVERNGSHYDLGYLTSSVFDVPLVTSFELEGEFCLTVETERRLSGTTLGERSEPACVTVDGGLEPPVEEPRSDAERTDNSTVTVDWPEVEGATGYEYRATDDGVQFIPWLPIPGGASTIDVDFGNRTGRICVYIRALGLDGEASYETENCVTILEDEATITDPECGTRDIPVSITNNGPDGRWYELHLYAVEDGNEQTVLREWVAGGATEDVVFEAPDYGYYNSYLKRDDDTLDFEAFFVRDCALVEVAEIACTDTSINVDISEVVHPEERGYTLEIRDADDNWIVTDVVYLTAGQTITLTLDAIPPDVYYMQVRSGTIWFDLEEFDFDQPVGYDAQMCGTMENLDLTPAVAERLIGAAPGLGGEPIVALAGISRDNEGINTLLAGAGEFAYPSLITALGYLAVTAEQVDGFQAQGAAASDVFVDFVNREPIDEAALALHGLEYDVTAGGGGFPPNYRVIDSATGIVMLGWDDAEAAEVELQLWAATRRNRRSNGGASAIFQAYEDKGDYRAAQAAAAAFYLTGDVTAANYVEDYAWPGTYDGVVEPEKLADPHFWLDIFGLAPVVGEIFDGANALLYVIEGDVANSMVSAAGMVPFVGSLGTARRAASKIGGNVVEGVSKASSDGKVILHQVRKADGTIVNLVQVVDGDIWFGIGRKIDAVPTIAKIGRQRPRGFRWAGFGYRGRKWTPELAAKYPDGVKINLRGYPEFKPYVVNGHEYEFGAGVLTGNRAHDARLATKAARESDPGFVYDPDNFTWHHVEDGRTMMLLPKDLHDAVPHTGGAAIIKNLFGGGLLNGLRSIFGSR